MPTSGISSPSIDTEGDSAAGSETRTCCANAAVVRLTSTPASVCAADAAPDSIITSSQRPKRAGAGVTRLLVTSTRRDGSLAGPDLPLLTEILEVGVPVLAAGGIASLDDLGSLRDLGCEGAVIGSALWSGRFSLAEALASCA